MHSSTSSSELRLRNRWRRFFFLLVAVVLAVSATVYSFIVAVDPFATLPFSAPITRWPVDGNARYAFPSLARSARFDSAIFGTSTSRLLRPVVLDRLFDARFANLAMNSATAYEQGQLMELFTRHHPSARVVLVGLDAQWCPTEGGLQRFTGRPFPAWMYGADRWAGYLHMFNLYTLVKAGQAFAEFTGLKPEVYGRDGYTRFTPPDSDYDAARAATHLRTWGTYRLAGLRNGPPQDWRYPALDLLRARLDAMTPGTRKILFFVPYNRAVLPRPGDDATQRSWDECKRRVASLARAVPNTLALDFMFPSAITEPDTNYWDGLHYREATADRIAHDLAAAASRNGTADPAFRVLVP
jgi:hypothetical protein